MSVKYREQKTYFLGIIMELGKDSLAKEIF